MADEQKSTSKTPLYINRELSMLEYFRRILMMRRRMIAIHCWNASEFLAFVGINMDEFFMVRVAGLKQTIAAGVVDIPATA